MPDGLTWDALLRDMRSCEQTAGQNVLEHGESVARYYADLYNHLTKGTPLGFEWRLPAWLEDGETRSDLLDRLLPFETAQTYQTYHDCGKPYCLCVDDDGRRHFPGHAQCSEAVWRAVSDDEQVARLIGMDMDIHLLKADGVSEFAARAEAATLVFTGLSEVHSNAAMFGGTSSTSFKIKLKQIDKRGRAILRAWRP